MNRFSVARSLAVIVVAFAPLIGAEPEAKVTFNDPKDDDRGPGSYVYPTDAVYTPGSFDLTEFTVTRNGPRVTFDLTLNSDLKDTWGLKSGFCLQMCFVFIQTS